MAKIVIDTNIIISAAFGGKPLEAVVRALEDHEVYLSEAIERELRGVISGVSKKLSKDQMAFLDEKMRQLLSHARSVSVSTQIALSRDAKDDHYLSLCKAARADFLITGDKDLLSVSQEALKKNGISCRIITPQEFLENAPSSVIHKKVGQLPSY
jgi:putative PIN family toxin of toxin-antitoxin system